MGMFSWNCCICKYPILGPYCLTKGTKFLNEVTMWAGASRISGTYDGYGRILTDDGVLVCVCERLSNPDGICATPFIAHTCCARSRLRPKLPSDHEKNQGHFWEPEKVERIGRAVLEFNGQKGT